MATRTSRGASRDGEQGDRLPDTIELLKSAPMDPAVRCIGPVHPACGASVSESVGVEQRVVGSGRTVLALLYCKACRSKWLWAARMASRPRAADKADG